MGFTPPTQMLTGSEIVSGSSRLDIYIAKTSKNGGKWKSCIQTREVKFKAFRNGNSHGKRSRCWNNNVVEMRFSVEND